jgi:hypothetical protein
LDDNFVYDLCEKFLRYRRVYPHAAYLKTMIAAIKRSRAASAIALVKDNTCASITQALVSFKKYMPPPLPLFNVNIYPFPLPHFASIFFAYL